MAECWAVAAGELVGSDVEAVVGELALEGRWEEAVLGADDVAGGNCGMSFERRRVVAGGVGRRARLPSRDLVGEVLGYVVEVADRWVRGAGAAAVAGGLQSDRFGVTGVGPPVRRTFAGERDHRGDIDQPRGGDPVGDQRRGESTERMRD